MFRIAYAVLHDHHLAEDALSEAFLNIARNMQKISAMSGQEREKYFVIIIREPLIKTQEKQGYSQKRGETSETDPYFG